MNANPNISFEAALKARYAAARGRIFAAGIRAKANDNERQRVAIADPDIPEWSIKVTRFDAHVTSFRIAVIKDFAPKRTYLVSRARSFGFSIEEIMTKTRKVTVVSARQMIMLEIKEKWPETSLPELGRMFGGLDHTTCLHAIRRARAYRDGTAEMRKPPAPRRQVKSAGCFGPGKKIKPELQDQIIRMFCDDGMTRAEIAEEFGLAYKTIGALLKRRGVTK